MEDTAKYLIHADFRADGVVERSDVVGAVFGQTEGLLGDDLDIRTLQQSSKLGRIDVSVDHDGGQSIGEITIASSLDRVETATLAAALEAIERIGPAHAAVEIARIEDVRAAKRRAVVDRAQELLATAFDEGVMDSDEILSAVRESVRVDDITEYAGYPAGPNVASSDAVIVVEGRADVLTLLKYGVKNAIAVEGTNVPEEIAELTHEKTVTAFLDGDRGGDLIRRELAQVGDLDYVAVAPDGTSVEDLSRAEVDRALRNKVPADRYDGPFAGTDDANDESDGRETTPGAEPVADDRVEGTAASDAGPAMDDRGEGVRSEDAKSNDEDDSDTRSSTTASEAATADRPATDSASDHPADAPPTAAATAEAAAPSPTLDDHVAAVDGAGTVRFLDASLEAIETAPAEEAFETLRDLDRSPAVVVVDGPVDQRLVDVAAQRGVGDVIARERGSFVKQPTSVRVRTIEELGEAAQANASR
ncbi:MAG: DNA primase DnaG [Halanaeroarchaeum sp.]